MTRLKPVYSQRNFEDMPTLQTLDRLFREKRGYAFKMPEKGKPVALILSGGLDSTILWGLLMEKYGLSVYPIHFYTPRYRHPLEAIDYFSAFYKKRFPELFHAVFYNQENNPLFTAMPLFSKKTLKHDLPLVASNLVYDKKDGLYKVGVTHNPARLGYYIFLAYEYVTHLRLHQGIPITDFFVGIIPDDGLINRESTLTTIRSINLSFCIIMGDFQYQFTGPVEKKAEFYYTKKDLVRYAVKNHIPFEKTWSCTQNTLLHQCGHCESCESRKQVCAELGIKDNTVYQTISVRGIKSRLQPRKKLIDLLLRINRFLARFQQTKSKKISIKNGTLISLSKNADWKIINDDLYLLHREIGELEVLNQSARLIWQEIAKRKAVTFSTLIRSIEKTYPHNKKQIHRDLLSFITKYCRQGYLEIGQYGTG